MNRHRAAVLLGFFALASSPLPTMGVVDCKLKPEDMGRRSMVIVIAKVEALGSAEVDPCGQLNPEVGKPQPLYFKCGDVRTLSVRVGRRIRGVIPDQLTIFIPKRVFGLSCDDGFELKVGQRLGLFLEADAGRFWSLSGEDSIQLLDKV